MARTGLLIVALASVAFSQNAEQAVEPQEVEPQQTAAPAADAGGSGTGFSRFRLHAYADVDFSHHEVAGAPNHFSVDEIILFGTATVTPKVSALAEVVIDTGATPTLAEVPVNVERLLLQFRVNDHLQIEAGQFRTAIGYYSTAYLRGAWFQTAISRPRMFAFEEDGGVLPLHTVGVSASGQIPSGAAGLHYVVETGNTRTWGSTGADVTGRHAINFSLFARPQWAPGLEVGISDYHDRYSPFNGLDVDRVGISAHVVYVANRLEFLNEGVVAHLRYSPAKATATLSGFYSQLGFRVGPNWGPYVRVEKLSVQTDSFFDILLPSVALWRNMYTAGVRYDWNDFVALKFEAGHEADWGAPHFFQAAAQIAFAF